MKKILLALWAVCVLFAYAAAQETGSDPQRLPSRQEIDRELCRLQEQTMDLDAQYWAGRIASGEFSYEELEKDSLRWVGDKDCNRRLMERIRKNLKEGNTAPLTVAEEERLEQTHRASRALLMPATQDKKLIDSLTAEQCIALDGHYWAWRVKTVKDVSLKELKKNASTTWPCPADYNRRIIEEVEKNIKNKQTGPLNSRESYIHDACTEFACEDYQEHSSDK